MGNTVEEELFIPSTHSYEVLKSELGQLMYENESGMFYIMMGGTLYEINLATTKEKEVVSGFEEIMRYQRITSLLLILQMATVTAVRKLLF